MLSVAADNHGGGDGPSGAASLFDEPPPADAARVTGAESMDEPLALAMAKDDGLELLTGQQQETNGDNAISAAATGTAEASGSGRASGEGGGSFAPSNASAVYRWYEIEEGFGAKRREQSALAKCTLCRAQGKPERKSFVRFSKSVTSNLWRHLRENHPDTYDKHAGEKKSVQMHRLVGSKKRGRKKNPAKVAASAAAAATSADSGPDLDATKLLESHEDLDEDGTSMLQRLTKKAKRGDQFFQEFAPSVSHQQSVSGRTGTTNGSQSHLSFPLGGFNPERVRDAVSHLVLTEMLPFELCATPAFRNLVVECSGGPGGFIDETNSFTMFAEDITRVYAKKLAADVKTRTAMQMKMTDFAHYVVAEWSRPVCGGYAGGHDGRRRDGGDADQRFVALVAVGLDQEFNPFRRCLQVSPATTATIQGDQVAGLCGDDLAKVVASRGVPYKFMPQLLAVEPTCSFKALCSKHKFQFLESVPTLLQEIMVATINEVGITDYFGLGRSVLTSRSIGGGDINDDSGAICKRRLDRGEFIDLSAVAGDSEVQETASPILDDLPSRLTGHTYRDIIHKVMYLLAHFKESPTSCAVLRRLALDDNKTDGDSFDVTFISQLRAIVVSVDNIFSVLCLVLHLMPAISKYFELHKDGDSDLSKLVQLCSLSKYEWSRAAYLKSVLKPFADATAKLDGEKYVVSSLIVPSVFTLLEKLRSPVDEDGATKKTNGAEMTEDLPEDIQALRALAYSNLAVVFGYLFEAPDAAWTATKRQTFNLLWSATLLDPRTRPFIIKGALSQHDFWEIIKVEAAAATETKAKDRDTSHDLVESGLSLDEGGSLGGASAKSGDIWDDLQANLASCAQEEMLLSTSKSALDLGKSSNLLEVEVSFFQEENRIPLKGNALEWWQGMRMKYPFLARLARYVLSIPCSVSMSDNPVAMDKGLMQRASSQLSTSEVCEMLSAAMNLRAEKSVALIDSTSKQLWSTV